MIYSLEERALVGIMGEYTKAQLVKRWEDSWEAMAVVEIQQIPFVENAELEPMQF